MILMQINESVAVNGDRTQALEVSMEKGKVVTAVISVVATFVLTLLFNGIGGWIAQDEGIIELGPVLRIGNDHFFSVDIFNYSGKPIDKLKLSIPKSIDITNIIASKPLEIKQVEHVIPLQQQNLIMLSAIEPNQLTRLLLPAKVDLKPGSVVPINAKELHLHVRQLKDISYPIYALLSSAALNAAVVMVIYMGMVFLYHQQSKRLDEQIRVYKDIAALRLEETERIQRELNGLQTEAKKRMEGLETKIKNAEDSQAKLQLLSSATMSDLWKELQFWRDTIRKIIVSNTGDKKAAENVITQVTEVLGSWKTQGRITRDFERLKMMAHIWNRVQDGQRDG